ncbi:hypothetical protein N0V90_005183 [Kalmusia sp. IMI 367209]|nr:hypothetical protein N0V90_005183 [Kalmusia sp. IMI 367209]
MASVNMPPMETSRNTKTIPAPRLIDPLRSRILSELRTHHHDMPQDFLLTTAKNLAFLVRHHAGPNIDPNCISLPILEATQPVRYAAALVLHERAEESRVLIMQMALHKKCLASMFSSEAEMAVLKILTEEMRVRKPAF